MSEDDDQTWQHGFDPGQDDPYGQGHESDALSADTQNGDEEIIVPPGKPGKAKPAKKQASSNDKKQTMIIIGVAVAAAIGWIGYGMLEGKPVNPANGGMAPAAPLQPARAPGLSVPLRAATVTPHREPSRSMLDTTTGASPASTYTTSTAQQTPSSPSPQVGTDAVPPPVTAAPSAIPVMGSSSALPMPMTGATAAAVSVATVSSATTSVSASPKTIVPTRMTTTSADSSASSVMVTDLKNQIAQLKTRIAQESLQLSAEKSAATPAPASAPKVIYRVIYRNVPADRTARPAHAAPRSPSSAVSIPGIRVIGAAQGTAWLSVQGHRMMVQIGDDVPGLGVVQSISDSGIVHGSHGTAQP